MFPSARFERAHPGRTAIAQNLATLFSYRNTSPPFIYLHDAFCPRRTGVLLDDVLHVVEAHTAVVNAQVATSHRLFFDAVLRQLAPSEEIEKSWADNIDDFCSGLRTILTPNKRMHVTEGRSPEQPRNQSHSANRFRVKGADDDPMDEDVDSDGDERAIVIVVTCAEHLKDHLADIVVPLTRLHELSSVELTTVFISSNSWTDVQPSFAASPDPYMIHIPALDREAMLATLSLSFKIASSEAQKWGTYSPVLEPLFHQFVSSLYSTCSAFVRDPDELAYIAAATWPSAVKPIVDSWFIMLDETGCDGEPPPPSEATRARLVRTMVPIFNFALDSLYPRTFSPAEFCSQYMVSAFSSFAVSFDANDHGPAPSSPTKASGGRKADDANVPDGLPLMAQFVLIAAYVASANPPRSDIQLFARAGEDRKKRRRGGHSKRQLIAKIPPRLAGPAPFPLDRLLALLGRLLEDYDIPPESDIDAGITDDAHAIAMEQAEMDVGRVQTIASVSELVTIGLLHRVGSIDKVLDTPPMFKCAISHSSALALARKLNIPLSNYLWENN